MRRASGAVELSTSPYFHPILPLLCDSAAHHAAHPTAPLPDPPFRHPEDAALQLTRAIAAHRRWFGHDPAGVWPSEGSVSDAAAAEAARAGFRWMASDEAILARSASPTPLDPGAALPAACPGDPRRRAPRAVPGARAVGPDRVHLSGLGRRGRDGRLPGAGARGRPRRRQARRRRPRGAGDPRRRERLGTLRRRRAAVPADALPGPRRRPGSRTRHDGGRRRRPGAPLSSIFAGSWINADFGVWIGHRDDRRAWELLGEARSHYAQPQPGRRPGARAAALDALLAAEGSDWCWWYGDDHSSAHDREFDGLFRRHLARVYTSFGDPVPEALHRSIITTRVEPDDRLRPGPVDADGDPASFFARAGGGLTGTVGRRDAPRRGGAGQRRPARRDARGPGGLPRV